MTAMGPDLKMPPVSRELAEQWVVVPRELLRRIVEVGSDMGEPLAWLFLAEVVAKAQLLDVEEQQ